MTDNSQNLPIYDITIGDDGGVDMISVVDVPAIGVDFIKLKDQKKITFVSDKSDRQLLYGPFLIPNMLIYRSDEKMGEYYVRFSAAEIEKIAEKFNESLNNKNINFMHTDKEVDAFVSQNWIIEDDSDKSKMYGFDLPLGTWFGAVKVKDQNFWLNQVKNDEVRGFSVEIKADLNLALKNKIKDSMKKLDFNKYPLKGGDVTVYCEGELEIGAPLFIDEALTQPAPDGDHTFEDGRVITVKDGKLTEIKEVEDLGYDKKEDDEKMAIDPNTGKQLPENITAEEVSMMIDNRFGELMEEITRLKIMIEGKDDELSKFKKEVSEKFSMTPATKSIKEKEVVAPSHNKFTEAERRIREFAKVK